MLLRNLVLTFVASVQSRGFPAMRFESVFPAHRFPLRRELLARTCEQSLEGDVARQLAAGVIAYASFEPCVEEMMSRVTKPGPGSYMPLVASLRPLGTMWLEAARHDGSRCGLLRMDLDDGSVRVRHLEAPMDGGPARCMPISLSLRRFANGDRPAIDWQALRDGRVQQDMKADGRWMDWADEHLAFETLMPGPTPADALTAFGNTGIRDLVMLAVAVSPLASPDVAALLAGDGT